MMLKPALRPPLRVPVRGTNAPREGVGGAPSGFGFLTLNGKVLQMNSKNLMLRNT